MSIIRVLDFETTGMEPPAEVCEIGWADYDTDTGDIKGPFSRLHGVAAMPPEVRAVHHISLAEVAGEPPFERDAFIAQAKSDNVAAVAAHNMAFEEQWLPLLKNHDLFSICTYKVALRQWPDAPSHSNGALRYWLEDAGRIPNLGEAAQPSHRAGPDAYVTAHILKALFAEGLTGKTMINWTFEPRVLPRCTIGKFRGKPWAEVEGGFLQWMTRQADMEADLKWNAQRELDRRAG